METETRYKIEQTKRCLEVTDADLSSSIFVDVNLAETRFRNVNLAGAEIEDANLSGVQIRNANLREVSITESQTEGMTIDGIAVSALLAAYRAGR